MNKDRRKQIADLAAQLAELEALKDSIKDALDEVMSDEQEYFDNMPEAFQQGDRGQRAEEAISNLESVISQLDDIDVSGMTSELETTSE